VRALSVVDAATRVNRGPQEVTLTKSRFLTRPLAAAVRVLCLSAIAFPAFATQTPSNEELYRMILELQAQQKQLVEEAARARDDAAQARQQLETTQKELEAAREELEARTTAAETPAVGAAGAGEGFVREADLQRGAAVFGEAHVLRATSNQQDFAILSTGSGPTDLATSSSKVVQSKYEASYKFGASYSPGGPHDFAVSYQGFDNENDASLMPPFETDGEGNPFVSLVATLAPPGFGQDATSASATNEYLYRSFDAEVGENLRVGENLALRLFGGIRYTHISEHFDAFYFGGDFDPVMGARANYDYSAWGVGPRVGAAGRYGLPWGLNVFGQAGIALLVGEQETEVGFVDPYIPDGEPDAIIHRDYGVRLFPSIDLRAGMGWEHAFSGWGTLFVDAGYEFQNYFNVVEQLSWGPEEAPGAVGESSGDLAIDGLFVRGGFHFNGP
jgi:hypothetical protein